MAQINWKLIEVNALTAASTDVEGTLEETTMPTTGSFRNAATFLAAIAFAVGMHTVGGGQAMAGPIPEDTCAGADFDTACSLKELASSPGFIVGNLVISGMASNIYQPENVLVSFSGGVSAVALIFQRFSDNRTDAPPSSSLRDLLSGNEDPFETDIAAQALLEYSLEPLPGMSIVEAALISRYRATAAPGNDALKVSAQTEKFIILSTDDEIEIATSCDAVRFASLTSDGRPLCELQTSSTILPRRFYNGFHVADFLAAQSFNENPDGDVVAIHQMAQQFLVLELPAPIPEPISAGLFALGAASLIASRHVKPRTVV